MKTYDEKIEWLFNQFPSYQKVGKVAYKPGIETMEAFDAALGHPHRKFRSVHVAGTNGKGSTCHMLAAGLAACGLKVGLYTSPHLVDFRERMKIVEGDSFRMIPKENVEAFLDRWHGFFEEHRPSFFEITTGMAFDFFADEAVDIAVIETGLGGRLDSTNVITPILSIITNIGLEHCEHLGYTLEAIAGEKAGIIKPGVPAVIGEFVPETRPVFEARAAACGSPLTFATEAAPCLEMEVAGLDLPGDYQMRNLCTLSAAVGVLQPMLGLDLEAFRCGVREAAHRTGLHGRWETLREADPVAGKARIICDTGHNAHGLRWVAEQIDRISCDYDNVFFILGLAREKDIDAIAPLLPRNVNYIYTQASSQRALPAVDLANEMADRGLPGRVAFSVAGALSEADRLAGPKDLIFVGGSNFVVCEIL
ncbi:MAG: bifunctional folylpolyglutamate synthase/dihydrofolate synthase [Bacteroidales bacterium]|nr:bifunctional folylpolyglutamate synthase/dihydrofolate synthase [Bacteroidales bacterium]MBR0499739.1 bifunctional folylpolyglutamate synthase/dihydrofolate synthase [Bacteroidales bacterium]